MMDMTETENKIISSQKDLLKPVVNSKGVFEKGEGTTKEDFVPLLNNEKTELIKMVMNPITG